MDDAAVRSREVGLFTAVPIVYVTVLNPDSADPSGWQSPRYEIKGRMLCL